MKKTPRWLWVILVSTVQLAALLAAVILLFSWLGETTDSLLGQQTCHDSFVIGSQVADSIETNQIRDIRLESTKDRELLDRIISTVELPTAGYIGVIDFGTGASVCHYPKISSEDQGMSGEAALYSLDKNSEPIVLRKQLSNQRDQRSVNGRVHWHGSDYFVNAQFLPKLNVILLVGQERSAASSHMIDTMQRSKGYAFAITLLIGLIGICVTIIIVTRIGETVDSLNEGLEKVVSDSARELVRTKNAVIFGLAKLAESRDNDTGEHLDRIRSYVTILAKEIAVTDPEFDEDYIHNLGLASSLHDIGKVGIPDSILLKPGRLTVEERGIMEFHTLIGGECLDVIHARLGENEFMHIARQIAYYHHERWDGTGYPHSLKNTEIPLVARIVAVADVYDALTSKRPYKKAMSHQDSREIIVSGSGKHFDPSIVDAFLRHEDEFEEISLRQQLLTDEEATSSFQRLYEAAKNSSESSELVTHPVAFMQPVAK